jgi:hypothetical protein
VLGAFGLRYGTRLCENSKYVEKWLAAVELLCLGERAMDEKPRKSIDISPLPLVRSSFHTVWNNNGQAIHFYERWGFRKVGVYDFVVGRDIQKDFVLLKNIHTV